MKSMKSISEIAFLYLFLFVVIAQACDPNQLIETARIKATEFKNQHDEAVRIIRRANRKIEPVTLDMDNVDSLKAYLDKHTGVVVIDVEHFKDYDDTMVNRMERRKGKELDQLEENRHQSIIALLDHFEEKIVEKCTGRKKHGDDYLLSFLNHLEENKKHFIGRFVLQQLAVCLDCIRPPYVPVKGLLNRAGHVLGALHTEETCASLSRDFAIEHKIAKILYVEINSFHWTRLKLKNDIPQVEQNKPLLETLKAAVERARRSLEEASAQILHHSPVGESCAHYARLGQTYEEWMVTNDNIVKALLDYVKAVGDAFETGCIGMIPASKIRRTIAENDPYREASHPSKEALAFSLSAVREIVHKQLKIYFPNEGHTFRQTKEKNIITIYDDEFDPLVSEPNVWGSFIKEEEAVPREVIHAYLQYLMWKEFGLTAAAETE